MELVKCRSTKYPGCVFLKVKGKNDFVAKVYARETQGEEDIIADAFVAAVEPIDAHGQVRRSQKKQLNQEDDGHVSLGEEQAIRQAGAY